MAAHNQWQQVAQQHLALLRQRQVSEHQLRQVSEHQVPQVALAEAALEAHLHQAVVEVQHLEHQRLQQQGSEESPHQYNLHIQKSKE